MSETPEPQQVDFTVQSTAGGGQDYGADWIAYASNTAAPDFVQGVDHSLNPFGHDGGGDTGGTAYA